MWGSLAVLALLTTINPVRLGIIILVLSRPRPMQNLLAYWTGAVLVGLATLVIPLFVLHSTPTSSAFARISRTPPRIRSRSASRSSRAWFCLAIAVFMVARNLLRTPALGRWRPSEGGGQHRRRHHRHSYSIQVHHPSSQGSCIPPRSRPMTDGEEKVSDPAATRPRAGRVAERVPVDSLHHRPHSASTARTGCCFALAIMVASGASLEVQVVTTITFVFGVLLVEEIILVSNVVIPARTQAALRKLHEWGRMHHQKFVAAVLAVVGLSLLARGMGGL